MKKGISIWAFAESSLENCFRLAKKHGFDGIELAMDETGELTPETTLEQIQEIRQAAAQYQLELYSLATGLYWKYPLTSGVPAIAERAAYLLKRQIDIAAHLGCNTVLVVPGTVTGPQDGSGPAVPYDIAYERAFTAVSAAAALAEQKKVRIGLENVWNKFLLSPLEMRDFIDQIGSPWIGAYFDVGNVVRDGYPEQWISILDKRIVKVHLKDYRRSDGTIAGFTELLCGDVNYPAVIQALRHCGYDDWVTAEVTPHSNDPEAALRNASHAMDNILKN